MWKLKKFSAVLLMGCSSATSTYNGPYAPTCLALVYLHAGTPVVLGYLWTMDSFPISRFTNHLTDGLFAARSSNVRRRFESCVANTRKSRSKGQHYAGGGVVCYGVPTGIISKD